MLQRFLFSTLLALSILPNSLIASDEVPIDILADRDPIGQSSYLKIDPANARTSALVRGGYMSETVLGVDDSDPSDPAISVKRHCRLDVFLGGTHEGEATNRVRAYFFSDAFLQNLRAGEIYTTPNFKIRHMGFRDAVNLDGRSYPHSDVLSIYDISGDGAAGGFGLNCLANEMFRAIRMQAEERDGWLNPFAIVTNLKMTLLLHPDAPVLGEVKADLTGVYNGANVKLGADYLVRP